MQGWKQSKPMKTIRKGKRNYKRNIKSNAPRFISRPPGMNLQTFDVTGSAVNATSSGSLTLLHCPQRTNNNYLDRYGDSTTIKSLRFQYAVKAGVSQGSTSFQTVRVCLFWDEQPNGAVPTGNLPFLALDPYSNTEPQFSYRFKLLRDCRHVICGIAAQDKDSFVDLYLKNLSLVTNFNQNNGVIGDINTGALYVYIIGDTALTSANVPTVTFSSRTRFVS